MHHQKVSQNKDIQLNDFSSFYHNQSQSISDSISIIITYSTLVLNIAEHLVIYLHDK